MEFTRYKLLTDTLYSLEEMIKEHKDTKAPYEEYKDFTARKNNILAELYNDGYIDVDAWKNFLLEDEMPFINIPEEFLEQAVQMSHIPNPTRDVTEMCKIKLTEVDYRASIRIYNFGERNIYSGPFDNPSKKTPEYFRMDIQLDPAYIFSEHEVIIGRRIKTSFKNFQNYIDSITKQNG